MPIFTPEEKKRIIKSLRSAVIATRFMTLKHLSTIARDMPLEFETLELDDPTALEEMLLAIQNIENSRDESLQREAEICLSTVRSVLSPKYRKTTLRCSSCQKLLCYGWNYCPYCGISVEYEEGNKCPGCNMNLEDDWNFCVRCGKKVREAMLTKICPQCNRETQEAWLVCPFCGKILK